MKTFAVRIYDNSTNVPGHESMAVTSYEDLAWINIRSCNDSYGLTEEEANALKAEYEEQIASEGIDWASVEVDSFDIEEDDDHLKEYTFHFYNSEIGEREILHEASISLYNIEEAKKSAEEIMDSLFTTPDADTCDICCFGECVASISKEADDEE